MTRRRSVRRLGFGVLLLGSTIARAAAPTAPAPAAHPTDARPVDAVPYALTPLPEITLTRLAPAPARRTLIANDVDWAMASPGGAYTLVGTDTFTSREAEGSSGRAVLYPARRRLPVVGIDHRRTRFSPDGRYLVVSAHTAMFRPSPNAPDERASPTITVLTVPELRVVATTPGIDPYWTSTD